MKWCHLVCELDRHSYKHSQHGSTDNRICVILFENLVVHAQIACQALLSNNKRPESDSAHAAPYIEINAFQLKRRAGIGAFSVCN